MPLVLVVEPLGPALAAVLDTPPLVAAGLPVVVVPLGPVSEPSAPVAPAPSGASPLQPSRAVRMKEQARRREFDSKRDGFMVKPGKIVRLKRFSRKAARGKFAERLLARLRLVRRKCSLRLRSE